ncbi:alpha/beta-hydrolase, partial [Rozella allomycis CSF55]
VASSKTFYLTNIVQYSPEKHGSRIQFTFGDNVMLKKNISFFDPLNKEFVLAAAGMSMIAYHPPVNDSLRILTNDPYMVFRNKDNKNSLSFFDESLTEWTPPPTTGIGFGWNETSVRGYLFENKERTEAIIAIKGTSLPFFGGDTAKNDKYTDNFIFSCCCAKVDRTWRPVCNCYHGNTKMCNSTCIEDETRLQSNKSYYEYGKKIVQFVQKYIIKHKNLALTGHSLGGSLSALLSLTFDIPAITFNSPGERLFAERLGLGQNPNIQIYHYGTESDPIFTGKCRGITSSCYIGGYAME